MDVSTVIAVECDKQWYLGKGVGDGFPCSPRRKAVITIIPVGTVDVKVIELHETRLCRFTGGTVQAAGIISPGSIADITGVGRLITIIGAGVTVIGAGENSRLTYSTHTLRIPSTKLTIVTICINEAIYTDSISLITELLRWTGGTLGADVIYLITTLYTGTKERIIRTGKIFRLTYSTHTLRFPSTKLTIVTICITKTVCLVDDQITGNYITINNGCPCDNARDGGEIDSNIPLSSTLQGKGTDNQVPVPIGGSTAKVCHLIQHSTGT
jgi:hypothetical protein